MDVLADLVEGGYVFRQLKPIHWDIHDRTALAEAELEYQDVTSPSVFVNFPLDSGVPAALDARRRPLARDDLDDHALDPAGQRRHRRPSRPRLRGRPLHRPRDRPSRRARSSPPTSSTR